MKHPTLRRAVTLATALAALSSIGAGAASASTWTVDDDKAQCPGAMFTSIQAAVDQAAPHDTINICDGTYAESSTPPNSPTQDPAQTGSRNGLTITKPLTIRGTGASKVTIMPAASLGATLAGTAPYLRDGGGNVVTVSRQSLGSTDANENFLDLSGVTITSPNAYVEAGIAFFNTSGRVANSTVGPLLRAADTTALAAAPHGWGIIMTNSLQGAEAGVRRELSVVNSLVTGYQSGGILFDDGRGADGAGTTTTRSGISEYGYVSGTRVVGSGANAVIPQTGVQYSAGARGSVTSSEIANNRFTTDFRKSVGLLLTDAASGLDPQDATLPAFSASGVSFTGNGYAAFNADAANSAVRVGAPESVTGSYFGCTTGPLVGAASDYGVGSPTVNCQGVSGNDSGSAPSLALGTPLTAAPTALVVPAAVTDAKPTGRFLTGDFTIGVGGTFAPLVTAADDFGVKRVVLQLDGTAIGTKAAAPYDIAPTWSPTVQEAGKTYTLTALVYDSSGQVTTTAPVTLTVVGDAFDGFVADTGSWATGDVVTGASAARAFTFTNHGGSSLRVTGVTADGAGFAIGAAGTSCVTGAVLAAGASCTATVAFTPTAAGAVAGTLAVDVLGGGTADRATVALTGTGVAPATTPAPAPAPTPAPAPPVPAPGKPAPATTTTKKVGGLTAVVVKAPKLGSAATTLKLGAFTCAKACTVKLTGTITVAGKKYPVKVSKRLSAGKATQVSLALPSAVRKALRAAGKGTLSLRITVGSNSSVVTLKVTA
jgi:hypothetical protein